MTGTVTSIRWHARLELPIKEPLAPQQLGWRSVCGSRTNHAVVLHGRDRPTRTHSMNCGEWRGSTGDRRSQVREVISARWPSGNMIGCDCKESYIRAGRRRSDIFPPYMQPVEPTNSTPSHTNTSVYMHAANFEIAFLKIDAPQYLLYPQQRQTPSRLKLNK